MSKNQRHIRCHWPMRKSARIRLGLKCNSCTCLWGKLCTVYNGIFSATPHVSYVLFKNVYKIGLIILLKKTDGYILVEILQRKAQERD